MWMGWRIALAFVFACGDDAAPVADSGPPPATDGGSFDAGGPSNDAGAPRDVGPTGSAGCGNASPMSGPLEISVRGETAQFIVSLPPSYDRYRAYPLGFAFHGAGRTHMDCQTGDCAGFQNELSSDAVLVYQRSLSPAWIDSGARDRNVAVFEALLDRMEAEYCVDSERIFVAGTSAGATFANIVACRYGNRLSAVIPVAGSVLEMSGCTGPVDALVIHGVRDTHVIFEYGEQARDFYAMTNGCGPAVSTEIAGLHMRVEMTPESHECTDYTECPVGSAVRWCEHSEGGYDGTTHGWPSFGGLEIADFVLGE
jgi:polyhydroxybutyrate depolymerase